MISAGVVGREAFLSEDLFLLSAGVLRPDLLPEGVFARTMNSGDLVLATGVALLGGRLAGEGPLLHSGETLLPETQYLTRRLFIIDTL